MTDKYRVKYTIHVKRGEFTKADALADNEGLTDRLALISMLELPDGSIDASIRTYRNEPWTEEMLNAVQAYLTALRVSTLGPGN